MKSKPYSDALGGLLEGVGFKNIRGGWRREVGSYQDSIDIQVGSSLKNITVNVRMINSSVHSLLAETGRPEPESGIIYPVNERLGMLMGGHDRWWLRSDPEGPAQVVEAVKAFALPFLDNLHSIEALKIYLEQRGSIKWRVGDARLYVAVLLSFMGRTDEALAALEDPPKRMSEAFLTKVEKLRHRLRADREARPSPNP